MKKQVVFVLISLLFLSALTLGVNAQSKRASLACSNVREARPFGISATIGGGNVAGISIDYFVIPEISLEAGFGLSQYSAIKYHFLGSEDDRHWSPFIGASYCIPTWLDDEDYREGLGFFAFPLGIHYISKSGFSFSVAAACAFYQNSFINSTILPWAGIRIGYHF